MGTLGLCQCTTAACEQGDMRSCWDVSAGQEGHCPGGACPGGICPGGICPGGGCPGGICPGEICPHWSVLDKPLIHFNAGASPGVAVGHRPSEPQLLFPLAELQQEDTAAEAPVPPSISCWVIPAKWGGIKTTPVL